MSTDQTTTPTADDLEARARELRAAEQQRLEAEGRARSERETAFRRQRLAAYNPAALTAAHRKAQRAFLDALEADPVFSAFAEAQAARWREKIARENAHQDAVHLARVDGITPPHDSGATTPPDLTPDTLIHAISNMVSAKVQQYQQAADEAFAAAVFGEGLTREQVIEAEQQAEIERRRQAARPAVVASVPAHQLTDQQREAMGLPARNAHRQPKRG